MWLFEKLTNAPTKPPTGAYLLVQQRFASPDPIILLTTRPFEKRASSPQTHKDKKHENNTPEIN
jgi:hypothetical protein